MDIDIGLLLTIGVACLFLAWLIGKVLNKMAKNTFAKIDGFNPTHEQTFITKTGITGIALDEDAEKIAISVGRGKPKEYEFSQIEDAAIEINETVVQVSSFSSQAVRGAAGAVLLGPAGLIIGALTGKKTSNKYLEKLSLKICVDDLHNPIHRVVFFDDKKININDVSSKEWAKDAERWVKIISRITQSKAP